MLSAEENERLCQVGPGTVMGEVLRRYWVPAFQAGDLPEPDCPPIGFTVLGEDFVAFRDSQGRLGVLDELCATVVPPLSMGASRRGACAASITGGSSTSMVGSSRCPTAPAQL
jgi:phthalate 4,5-dioxygenase oxygenase subunit